jgi:hypothetical protein
MNYLSSQEQEAAYLEQHSLDGSTGDMSNGTVIVNESSDNESSTESLTKPRSSAMSEHSSVKGTPQVIREWLMSLPQDSPANHSASPENEKALTTKETCGQRQQTLFGLSGLDSFCLKTCPEYASTCPWSSETCGDLVTPFADPSSLGLEIAGRRTSETESGLWLGTPRATQAIRSERFGKGRTPSPEEFVQQFPTPKATEHKGGFSSHGGTPSLGCMATHGMWPTPRAGKTTDENEETWMKRYNEGKVSTPPLTLAVKMWPTPTVQDAKNNGAPSQMERNTKPLNAEVGGSLNPTWVEWLMGWPLGWTDLKPLAMDKFREWLRQHGRF